MPSSTPKLTLEQMTLQTALKSGLPYYEIDFEQVGIHVTKDPGNTWRGTLTTSRALWGSSKCRLMLSTDASPTPEQALDDLLKAVEIAKTALGNMALPTQKYYVDYMYSVPGGAVGEEPVQTCAGPFDTEAAAQACVVELEGTVYCYDMTIRATAYPNTPEPPSRLDRLLEEHDPLAG